MALRHEQFRDTAPSADLSDELELDDEFEDAHDEEIGMYAMDLTTALGEAEVAMMKFFNNEFDEARQMVLPWASTSFYPALGVSMFEFIPAVLTFDSAQIATASRALKRTIALCNVHRRNFSLRESLGSLLTKKNTQQQYTDLEAHAELCYGEALLLLALLTFIEDEDLPAFIRGSMKIKSCYNSYKHCSKILQKKEWECETNKIHFESGVRMGVGLFNLMISLLPAKIISLLEFVGFTGNKSQGLADLEAGCRGKGLRQQLCHLTVLGYNLIICHYIGAEGDLEVAETIISQQLEIHPNGVWFLLFAARLEFMRGQFDRALETYEQAMKSQNVWKQFHHLCYWEMMWLRSLKLQWREAAELSAKLMEDSVWSRTIYSYQRAAMLLQEQHGLTDEERRTCTQLIQSASLYKQRIAGKSVPMEKFIIKRCARYMAQDRNLVLPALEMMCLWNMFETLPCNTYAGHAILKIIEDAKQQLEEGYLPWEAGYESDNRALLLYLHGCCLRNMASPRLAISSLERVLQYKGSLKEDTFLLPYALAEIALCHSQLGDVDAAIAQLRDVRKKFSGYSLESRLQFRIHSKMEALKNKKSPEKK